MHGGCCRAAGGHRAAHVASGAHLHVLVPAATHASRLAAPKPPHSNSAC